MPSKYKTSLQPMPSTGRNRALGGSTRELLSPAVDIHMPAACSYAHDTHERQVQLPSGYSWLGMRQRHGELLGWQGCNKRNTSQKSLH